MTRSESTITGRARGLAQDLRALGEVQAPPVLRRRVVAALEADCYAALETAIGPVWVAFNDQGLSAVELAGDAAAFERSFQRRFGRGLRRVERLPASLERALRASLAGPLDRSLRFDLRGLTDFQRSVLLKALEIPAGQVRPYSWLAREIGHPGASRAVGSALADNPIPLFIPCHRVVRGDGRIGNYGLGGPANKRALLALEGAAPEQLEEWARCGLRFLGSDTTHVYCFPTCAHARRIQERHRVPFRSAAQAHAAGYRPCAVCRPAAHASGPAR